MNSEVPSRPAKTDDADALLRMQQEYQAKGMTASASVKKANPSSVDPKKKPSIFSQNLRSMPSTRINEVVTDIVERSFELQDWNAEPPTAMHSGGFPIAMHRTQQHYIKDQVKKEPVESDELIDGMSVEEKLEVYQQIVSKLDPGQIEFLLNRRKTVEVSTQESKEGIESKEPEKLEWMKDLDKSDQQNDKDSPIRFDFKGIVLSSTEDLPTTSGLFHHGKNPSHAGYCIAELVHLSRSTVPNQRALSIKTLNSVFVNLFNQTIYTADQQKEIKRQLSRHKVLLHIRVALDASHNTVVTQAIEALATYIGFVNEGKEASCEDLWDLFSLSRTGYRVLALSIESLSSFTAKSSGKDASDFEMPENNGSLDSITSILAKDAISGLLATNILTRLRYLLRKAKLPCHVLRQTAAILTAIARHDASSAQDILECPDLLDAICHTFSSLNWPIRDSSLTELALVKDSLRLMRLLLQSGRDAAAALLKHRVGHLCIRYLTFLPQEALEPEGVAMKLRIAMQVWDILGVVYSYGLGASLFDEYRSILVQNAEQVVCILSNTCAQSDSPVLPAAYHTLAAINRCLCALMMRYRKEMDAGGANDCVAPFVSLNIELLLKLKDTTVTDNLIILCASAAQLLKMYFSQAYTFQYQASGASAAKLQLVNELMGRLADWCLGSDDEWSSLKLDVMKSWESLYASAHCSGISICSRPTMNVMSTLVRTTLNYNALSSLLEMEETCARLLGTDPAEMHLMSESCLESIRVCCSFVIGQTRCANDGSYGQQAWLKFFGQGKPQFLACWSRLALRYVQKHLKKDSDEQRREPILRMVATAGVVCISELPPGDETLAAEWINGYLLSNRSIVVQSVNSYLSDVYSLELFSTDLLKISNGFYRHDESYVVPTLMIDCVQCQGRAGGSLPIRYDWIYQPLTRLYTELKTHGTSSIPEDVELIVQETLSFILLLEKQGCLTHIAANMKLLHLMRVFMLRTQKGDDLFRGDAIEALLSEYYRILAPQACAEATSTNMNLETAATVSGGKMSKEGTSFYLFYQDLLDHYTAVSFCNATFQRYLILPLIMMYPSDYRLSFWTTMKDICSQFNVGIDEGIPVKLFVEPKETNVDILNLQRQVRQKLPKETLLHFITK